MAPLMVLRGADRRGRAYRGAEGNSYPEQMRLLFVHGAGGFDEDRGLAAGLGAALGAAVDYPRLPDQDMSYAAWSAIVRAHLGRMETDDVIVGHSFGASILLKVLSQDQSAGRATGLLAMPDWSPAGWDVSDYLFDGPEAASTELVLHHCRDDDVVPFAHMAQNAERLPAAQIHEHQVGGHQFDGLAEAVARSLSTG